jgi:hypothetical protein
VPRAAQIKRILLSLSDASLRVDWLADALRRWPPGESAHLLNELLEATVADPGAREVLLSIAMLFVGVGDSPLVTTMREQAIEHRLFSLERLLRAGPPPSVHAPPAHELPVPDYGAGRELTLGERRSLARRPNRRAFEKLLSDPHPMVIRQLLANPRMKEDDVVRIAARRPARIEALRELARCHRWLRSPRVRMAVLLNPGSPLEFAIPLLGLCTRKELEEVVSSASTALQLRVTAHELLVRRPPMKRTALGSTTIQ